ncbi:hypothetical protein A4G99_14740 [Haladaptatus sp. R4]|nr:hypothetical protein A4G99_14740 [Haladaptatus sp. R4]
MTTKIGYVGLDHHHCQPYLDSIDQLDVELTATADERFTPEALDIETASDAPHYGSVERLLDDSDVDLVWITLSNRDTPEVIEAAVERGIDVFTEKPAARTATDLEPVAAAARESEATVGVSYTWRGHPISKQLHELRRSGFFGDVRSFDLRFVASSLRTRDTDHYLFENDASRGGIVQWLGVHWLDLVPWILDDPIVRVNANLSAGTPEVDIEDERRSSWKRNPVPSARTPAATTSARDGTIPGFRCTARRDGAVGTRWARRSASRGRRRSNSVPRVATG